MIEDILRPGTLDMSLNPITALATESAWGDYLINNLLVGLAIFLFLLSFREFIQITPLLLQCLDRSKANISMEHSLSQARVRNLLALEAALPFCLISDRYELFRPDYWDLLPRNLSALASLVTCFAFLFVRKIIYLIFKPKRLNSEALNSIHHCPYNYFIILSAISLIITGVLCLFNCPQSLIKATLLWFLGAFYLFSIVRIRQVLSAYCGSFSTILYLCALELLPTGLLITCAVAL